MLMSYENDRRTLANRAQEVLGDEAGETLMEHLPHGGYSDMATKQDLDSNVALLRRDLDSSFALLRQDLQVLSAELRKEIADSARRQTFAILGLMFAMMSAQTALISAFVR